MATRRTTDPDHDSGGEILPPGDNWPAHRGAMIEHDTDDDLPETPADRIAGMLADVAGDVSAKVSLARKNDEGAFEWCADYRADQFEKGGFEMIRRDWGAGVFEIRLYASMPGPNGKPKFALRSRPIVTIAASPTGVAVAQDRGGDIAQALAPMLEAQREMLRALTERPAQPDPMAQMQTMFAMMAGMREAMGIGGQQSKSTIGEIVDAIKELKGAKSLLGDEPESETGQLVKMLPGVLELVQSQMKGAQQVQPIMLPPSLAQNPRPRETPAQPNQPEQEDTEMGPIQRALIRTYTNKLLNSCANAAPIVGENNVADWLYCNLPDEMLAVLKTDEWFEILVELEPKFEPYQAYLTEVRAEVQRLEAVDIAGDTGDAASPGGA